MSELPLIVLPKFAQVPDLVDIRIWGYFVIGAFLSLNLKITTPFVNHFDNNYISNFYNLQHPSALLLVKSVYDSVHLLSRSVTVNVGCPSEFPDFFSQLNFFLYTEMTF